MALFLSLMALAAGISLLRGFAVAALIETPAFGVYAAVYGVGAFGSILISGGRVELTQKMYPRLWTDGQYAPLLSSADRVASVLALRAAGFAMALAAAAALLGRTGLIGPAVAAAFLSWAMTTLSLYSSAHRASRDLSSMGSVTLQRSAAAVALGCIGAWLASWPGALAGEMIGSFIGAGLSRRMVVRLSASNAGGAPSPAAAAEVARAGERWLFAAGITAAVPVYLDRLFVAHRWGVEAVGRYGFLMLLVTGANVVTGIVAQKVGPQLVHMRRSGAAVGAQVRIAARWIGACSGLYLLGMALAGFALLQLELTNFAVKFDLDAPLLAIAAVLCCLQLAHIVEWFSISHDRERDMYSASNVYLGAAVLAAALAWRLDWSMVEFFAALTLAKAAHVVTLIGFGVRVARRSQAA